jgi:hypothetical protein
MSMASSAGKTAFKAVRGAEADVTPIRVQSPDRIAAYSTLQVGQVTTDVPPIVRPQVLDKIREGLREGMADSDTRKAFPGGGKALRLDVLARFYKGKGMIGGEGRLDWMVTLTDAEANEVVGTLYVEGVSESPLQHGAADMAKENTQQLVKFLRKYKKR